MYLELVNQASVLLLIEKKLASLRYFAHDFDFNIEI